MDEVTRLAHDSVATASGADWGRFAPGTLLAGRFRIVAPLGRGGMGELYRAEDLKLGQTVALKFLPEHLSHDPVRLAQFHNEVRSLIVGARHSVNVPIEYNRLTLLVGTALFGAAAVWLTYIALEPFVRRFWPELLIGWSRLITGTFRDPGVGREVLVGVASGAVTAVYILSHALAQRLTGSDPPPVLSSTAPLDGVRAVLVTLMFNIPRALISPFQVVFVVVLLKALVKRTWLVVALACVIVFPIAINGLFSGEQLAVDGPYLVLGSAMVVAVLLRFGLVALCVTFFVFETLVELPTTLDFSMPYAAASTWLLAGAAALAAFGFYAARGDEPLLGKALLD